MEEAVEFDGRSSGVVATTAATIERWVNIVGSPSPSVDSAIPSRGDRGQSRVSKADVPGSRPMDQ